MKTKLLLFIIGITLSPYLSGQSFIWEAFEGGQMPPSGWTISGIPDQWTINNGSNAGGTAPEGMFTYISQTTTTRLISPSVNLTGLTTVKVSFKHFYDWYANPAPKVGVATRSHGGTWNTVYEVTPTGNLGPQQIDVNITNSDVGQDEFQICIYLNGNMFNLDYYYVDNILLYNPLNKDGAMISLAATPTYFKDPVQVKGTIMNVGTTAITEAEIQWQLDNGMVHSNTFTGFSIATQETYDFTCTDLMMALIGAHNLKVWIKNVNGSPDDFLPNDTMQKTVNRICHIVDKTPLFEEFTSSTCNPCAVFNTGFVPWCNTHEDQITLVKYQMNWPGAGDPYYTAEGGVRRDYYGVGGVPDLYCNGSGVPTSTTAVQAAFDQAVQQLGMMKIATTHTLSGHVISVNVAVLPLYNFPNSHVYIVVMEKVTHNNATTNGETSFEHVMMKMLPDANGTSLDFTDRVPVNITETFDLTGTHVEEWNDLIVGVFVQEGASKLVYQSAYSLENGNLADEARLASISKDGQPIAGFTSDDFDYDVHLPAGTVLVPEITAIPVDDKETVIIVPANELPGTTTIDVFAENLMAHNLYSVNFIIDGVGIGEPGNPGLLVYPNPSGGLIYLQHAEHACINVTSTDGTAIMRVNDFTGASLNLKSLPSGVYILSVEKPDHSIFRKKIVLLMQ